MRRSLYVAASWGGWKDPLGIIVGGVDLGGMAFETDANASGRTSPKARLSIRNVARTGGRVVVDVRHDLWW